jgi:HD-like signal output (HDOD) protein
VDPIAPSRPFITQALRDLGAWVAHFRDAEIPVLGSTSDALEAMRANEDDVDANLIGEMVADDPLMTLKVLAYSSMHRPPRLVTDVETVTAAVVLMGISPFFGAFGVQPTIEDRLADEPEALEGLGEVLRRAHRAAQFALSFAVHRMDHDAAVIYEATLLHDFAEMLLWCHAPTLALRIRAAQKADPTLRSHVVQKQVLNVQLFELQQALMRAWALPELLIQITDDRHARHPSVQNVMLAVRLARHSSESWDNPAIPDDIVALSQLLNLSEAATLQFVRDIES